MILRRLVLAAAMLVPANAVLAQPKEPIGRFVVDVRGASAGLPSAPGWTPVVPSGTVLPSRGLALDLGAHVYLLRTRRIALGVGAAWLKARATTTPPDATETGSTPAPVPTIPDVTTRVTTFAPQLSINFGHSLGWSYLSAGLGRSRVESGAILVGPTTVTADVDSGWVKSLNWGGGARWFINDHVGVGFDLRWHKVNPLPAADSRPGGPRISMLMAGAGIVLK